MNNVKFPSKHLLYELSVQNPKWQVDYLPQFHQWFVKKKAYSMREDFCGTAKISCEWVKLHPKNRALGVDIDADVLDYARKANLSKLKASEQKRLALKHQNVLEPTREKFDLIGAHNFSFFVFHERKEMLKYARSAFKSLKSKGTFFLELAGGEGFKEPCREVRTFKVPGVGKVQEVWEQHQYDPITHVSDFSIHFKLPKRKWMNDAFTYHWRLWTVRELREILLEAGFKETVVLWESFDSKGKSEGEYLPVENADHVHDYIAYVVGVKK